LINFSKLLGIFLVGCAALNSSAFADTLIVNTTFEINSTSSKSELSDAVKLILEGKKLKIVIDGTVGSLTDIARALASASPENAAQIGVALAALASSPEEAAMIKQAIKNLGVEESAWKAAVNTLPPQEIFISLE